MNPKKKITIIKNIMKNTHTDKIIEGYLIFVVVSALLIRILDPAVNHFGDALWYCYSVLSTAGFGDIIATTFLTKIISVLVTIYTTFVVAIVTGVVVNYYMKVNSIRDKETIGAFMDKLEHLPELSKEELEELSRRVVLFRESGEIDHNPGPEEN